MDQVVSARPNADGFGVTAVVAALREEVAPLRRRLSGARHIAAGVELVSGHLENIPVAIAVTGDGPSRARTGIDALLRAVDVRRLLVIGVSGALSPELCLEDLVVGERLVDEAVGGELRAPSALLAHVEQVTRARRSVLVSARRIADTPAEKQRLRAAFANGDGLATVDLESHAFAQAAAAARVPWLCLRSVSDAAGETLPALLERSRGESGSVHRSRVALGMLREPRLIAGLWRLRQRVERCALLLARAVEALLLAGGAPDWSLPGSSAPVRAGAGGLAPATRSERSP
jgi:nucleoside phosphorylase